MQPKMCSHVPLLGPPHRESPLAILRSTHVTRIMKRSVIEDNSSSFVRFHMSATLIIIWGAHGDEGRRWPPVSSFKNDARRIKEPEHGAEHRPTQTNGAMFFCGSHILSPHSGQRGSVMPRRIYPH